MQSGQAAAPVSPLQKLQQDFDSFASLFKVMSNMINAFPIDIIDKKLIGKNFLDGFGYAQNILMAIAQQHQASAQAMAAPSDPVPPVPAPPAPAAEAPAAPAAEAAPASSSSQEPDAA